MLSKYVIGLDYGTLSGRAVVADVRDGAILGESVMNYPHGLIEGKLPDGASLPSDYSLEDPNDYYNVLTRVIPAAVKESGINPNDIIGIGLDVTSSTFLPVDEDCIPLLNRVEFAPRPHAWMKMWKHHGAQPHADRITALMNERNEPFRDRVGCHVNSEWMLPKLLEIYEDDPEVFDAANSFAEAGDWLVFRLTGSETRSAGPFGYKLMRSADDDAPDRDFLEALAPGFSAIYDKLKGDILPLGSRAGSLSTGMANVLGLRPGISVATANIDAHVAYPAVGRVEKDAMILIIGTSCCDLLCSDSFRYVPGVSGIVKDGIVPGLYGYEAGQSAVGDIFDWFVKNCVPSDIHDEAASRGMSVHDLLTEQASGLKPGESGLVALDWWNGNRSCLADSRLRGLILGLGLDTRPCEIYRALLESAAYGLNEIITTFGEHGVPVGDLYACGGIAHKNPLLMQIYADITGRSVFVAKSGQAPALGSAIHAAAAAGVCAGGYEDIFAASSAMGGCEERHYSPDKDNNAVYNRLFDEYHTLYEYYGRGTNDVMKRLLDTKNRT